MLIQELRLKALHVQVFSERKTSSERIRVVVSRGSAGGIAQVDIAANENPAERERLINLITATAIREICAELDGYPS